MNVNDIRDRIVELSHQSAGDGEVQAKALGWLNAAYHELMDEVVAYLPPMLQQQENVPTGAGGEAVLADAPYRVLRVVDAGAGRNLEIVTPGALLDLDPMGTATGAPQRCVLTGSGVRIHPAAADVALTVLYVPVVADLAEGGIEATIVLPKAYHYALVWGGLVWSALFERGFGTQGELVIFQRQWADAKERVKLGLLHNTGASLRVQPFNFV
jgi:hypothetical protein